MSAPSDRTVIEEVVAAYFEAIRRGDSTALGAMFGDDGELVTPLGPFVGAAEVSDFYAGVFSMGVASPLPGPVVVDGNRAAVEIVLDLAGSVSRYGDFFTIDVVSRRIRRLVIYTGGPA